MTARPAFSDFIIVARGHVSAAVAGHQADRSGEHVQEVSDSLLHVITVLDKYLQDITAVPGGMQSRAGPPMTAWGHARLTAREALSHAARHLHAWRTRAPGVAARSELARQLDAAAATLTAGRDLLHTHLASDPRGARQFRSEWGLVVCSPPVERALLAELAWLAYKIAPPCADVARSARSPDAGHAQRGLRAACQWLHVLSGSVQAAHQADPVSTTDRELLLAIPLNIPCPVRSWTAANQAALHRLGYNGPDLMRRAADIDRAGAQLIIEATGRDSGTHASGYQPEPPEAEP